MKTPNFEQLPNAVAELRTQINEIKSIILEKIDDDRTAKNPLSIKEVSEITMLSVPTIYSYCQKNKIPHSKVGNRLYFFRQEIIGWIKLSKRKSLSDLMIDAENYLKEKGGNHV
ncbi:helix-turn-helix domain-containing protein [Psychroserpens sp.]|uniref:helix-turn-helix domain-containing protein n=1 Tax=Psychroserpens sp. TaxID=2020870 RepID=UPI001B18A9A9|nr:helix-turn-helix domain-containing protein [Psychroserpens sp.]MBO6607410.1 helix-turn-helix domain-containing protein [Psychroserpens sp.]MBO6631215.1 helix-turn-helix domain-containing protein [Psychroserpens sp.]MBO6654512.1 helix-turn-helix domain-containing protein [Psychroserpens sp.]MBO6681139.1 helix-turn-helix domain-containing protein [Psychroserpens sp.]MBO6749904.1 helix-turn-helix domain-containing protein [Psychroserpens sp.]